MKLHGSQSVLLYESSPIVLTFLRVLLQQCGFVVHAAVWRIEDLRIELSGSLPDIIVVSDHDSRAALQAAAAIRQTTDLPVILCTENLSIQSESECSTLGIAAVVPRTASQIGCLVGVISRCMPEDGVIRSLLN
jgi:CheY-like chemotaxis protein